MSKITSEILQKVAPGTPRAKRDRFLPDLNECLPRYGIIDRLEVAAFLTTVCFESDYFKALAEYASGWDYDITRNRKKAIELGNTQPGDGPKYKGAGGIETTGKKNYRRLSDRLGVDFVANPNLLRTQKYFVEAACVFWDDNHFNEMADDGEITRIENITNRGSGNKTAKALSDRLKIYRTVLDVLPEDFELDSLVSAAANIEGNGDAGIAPTPAGDPAPTASGSAVDEQSPTSEVINTPPSLTPRPTIWERMTAWKGKLDTASSFKNSLNPFTPSISPISGTSGVSVVTTKAGGWIQMIHGIWTGNKIEIIVGAALIIGALAYLAIAKRNAAKRSTPTVDAPVQQTNVEVKTT